jgi:methionyl-tRNA synthetase
LTSFFITTAIDYTNAPPHIGHAYEKILADVIARYHRLKGDDVFLLSGVDQHGQKVQQSAEKQGVAPQEFVDGITAKFTALWTKLDVRYDGWAATTDPRHKTCVQKILQRLWDEKDAATGASRWIYKAARSGYYSVRQEQFLTDKERGPDGEFGPEWGQVEFREEENYYFRLAEHKQWLLDLIEKRSRESRPLVVPDFRVAELRNAVEKIEGDLCISRPKARLSWGIEFPFDPDFVTYVWFDALVNYISFAPDYDPTPPRPPEEFLQWWRTVTHVIGKDILIPAHGIYWPVMLKALGFADDEMPTLLVHGWWNIAGAKMSKSTGNIVDPDALADKYGVEALRYYLMADIATGRDADFNEERLVMRYNTDLANSVGNLLNRTLNMAAKYRDGRQVYVGWELEEDRSWGEDVRRRIGAGEQFEMLARDEKLLAWIQKYLSLEQLPTEALQSAELFWAIEHSAVITNCVAGYSGEMNRFSINSAMEVVTSAATSCNTLVDRTAPWKLVKMAGRERVLDAVLYGLAESLRIIAILISPVLPKAAAGIFAQLNWTGATTLDAAQWGGLPDEHVLGKPVPLFPRIDVPGL